MFIMRVLSVATLLFAAVSSVPCPQKHGMEVYDSLGRILLHPHECNVFLNASLLQNPPQVILPGLYTNTTQKFTLMLLEKHNNTIREVYYLHWLLANISPQDHSLTLNKTSIPLVRKQTKHSLDYIQWCNATYIRPLAPQNGTSNYTLVVFKQNITGPLIVQRPTDIENFWPDVWIHSLGNSVVKEYTSTSFFIESAKNQLFTSAPYHPMPFPAPHQQYSTNQDQSGLGQTSYIYSNSTNNSYPNNAIPPPQPPPPYNPHSPPYNPHTPHAPPYNPPSYNPHLPPFNQNYYNYSHYNQTNGSYPYHPPPPYSPPHSHPYNPRRNDAYSYKIEYGVLIISIFLTYFL